jgi:hypothetical protein
VPRSEEIRDAEGAPSGSAMSKEDKARAEALYQRGVDIGFDAIAYSNRMREIVGQPPLDRDTILANSLAEQDAKQQWAKDNPEFDLAIWYQQQQTDPALKAKLAQEITNAENNYDPGRGEMANLGNNFENYAYMNVYEKPFIDKIRESNASISATLSSPLEIDYPYNYDATTLYMKVPPTMGNYDMTQGFSQEERAKYNYLRKNGKFIDTMANIISTAVITTEAVKGFTGETLSLKGVGILTSSIQSSLNAAITGGNVSDAFLKTLATQVERVVRKSLNDGTFAEDASSTWDRASGTYGTLYEQEELANAAADKNSTAVNEINGINKAITDEATELDRLIKVKSDLLAAAGGSISNMTADQINAYGAADKAAARYEADFIARVADEYTPRLVSANEVYETSTADYNAAKTAYEEAYGTLLETTQKFDDSIKAQLPEIAKATIADINPNFDPKFYAKQNGIDESEAYQHYMSNGLYNNLPGSSKEYVDQYRTKQWGAVNTSLSNLSVDPTKITPEQYTSINSILSRNIDINSNAPIDQAEVDRLVLVALAADVIPKDGLVTAGTNAILKAFGRPEQEVGTPLTDNSIKILTNNAINTQDNQDISNSWTPNSQLVADRDTGLLKWEDVSLSFDDDGLRWDDTRGEFVHWRSDGRITDTRGNFLGTHITVTEGNNTLEWLKANNPEGYLAAVAEMEETSPKCF